MIKKWPTFKRGGTNDKFWKETYEKYGTCIKDLTKFNTINKYYKNTMDLYDKYKMKEILANGDSPVTPSITKKYILSDVTSALNKGLGVNPAVYCVEKDNEQYLWEIRMCFNKKLKAINCGTSHENGDKCDSEKKISYPKFPPLVIG
ncbi:ribonuclease Oy-like [Strongylocentrotus purpuratus]|uniref:Uncharacterized protein n=1 Tax=Strongylocentrotus purpuratus TaxID=7668 RepID=A0A7M7LWK7_STRPU|nr:ribonuclease Oy-like [Strongylocentrotus purpuratus]